MLDSGLFRVEVSLIVGALVVTALWTLLLAYRRRGVALSATPIWAGLIVRVAAVAVAAAVPAIGHKLSSTDEAAFLATTHRLAALPFTDGKWVSLAVHWTEVIPWALTLKLFGNCGTLPLRLEQIGLSLAAVIIVSATASRIGGPRAGFIAAWIAALEPSSVYFAGLIHQESLCMLGEALLLAALVDAWRPLRAGGRPGWRTVGVVLIGLALIFGTRSYMAFFAGVSVILVLLAALLRRRLGLSRGLLAVTVGALLVALAGILAAPHVVPRSLANLQHQLNFDYVGANLPLGHTDVLSSPGLVKTVVLRSLDLILRPFPWQLGNTSQKVAVAGTLLWYALLALATVLALRNRRDDRLVPVVILLACETVGFALTLVDAGEGFRHRINLILMLSVPLGVLGASSLPPMPAPRFAHRRPRPARHFGVVAQLGLSSRALAPVVGAGAGLLVAFGFAVALPARYQAAVAVALPGSAQVTVPEGAAFSPQAQLYGALGPGKAPATLSFSATAETPHGAISTATGAARHWRSTAPRQIGSGASLRAAEVTASPRIVRDLLLGLLAGLLLGVATAVLTQTVTAPRES